MLVISNRSRASHSSDFEITRSITPLGPITITNQVMLGYAVACVNKVITCLPMIGWFFWIP